ncbi:hypothetical protein [Acinetobacter gyllenbergii]|uniref:hypothetical protein n=1 Tax=Acinetobacter gyllenbergii TaxID=134534 RepID=UPI003F56DC08
MNEVINYQELFSYFEADQNIDFEEKQEIFQLLKSDLPNDELSTELDNLEKSFFAQGDDAPLWAKVSASDSRNDTYEVLKAEVFEYLCTNSEKYKKE